ncbi:MAG: methylated-DNA--[protein]-cysteine S-methyltransferase [Clostridium sp.]|nr:methylated-DNA--[protein]-cysteine S-methyltransferase [Clostridium sp.]
MKNIYFYHTPIGKIGIADNCISITNLYFNNEYPKDNIEVNETELLKEASSQLMDYFSGKKTNFNLPFSPEGTSFQKKVWDNLLEIPFGETRSYGEIAKSIGNSKAARAVGMANNRNPIPIFIPCHRVIGANGSLVGYGGGLEIKKFLLNLEKGCTFE